MFRKAAIAALALTFFAPSVTLLGVGALMNPAAANCEPENGAIFGTFTTNGAEPETAGVGDPASLSSRVVFPLPEGTWVLTSPFGMRTHPITGEFTVHTGTDLAAPDGTSILAAADGTVTVAQFTAERGGKIIIEHTVGGYQTATDYRHMWQHGIHVKVGDRVTAGQHIGDVGSSGYSTGPHLHFEVHLGGTAGEAIDAGAWLNQHAAANLPEATSGSPAGCRAAGTAAPPTGVDGDPDRLINDPTTGGQITARLLHLYQQTLSAFPDTGWGCYSPRPGTKSEHPLGRACDITFGNRIGQRPNPTQLDAGWAVTNWMKENAEILGVSYLIWQGQIWSVARDANGWRPYNGGGMHDPNDVTGGHYDHLHVTVW